MAYSPLGFSLPQLAVSGFGAPSASYGGTLAVTIDVRNLGSSSIIDPLALEPGAPANADAGPFDVEVFITKGRSKRFNASAVPIGLVHFAGLPQNGLFRETAALNLPARPRGFPTPGHQLFLAFVADPQGAIHQLDRSSSVSLASQPVQLSPNLPDLFAVGLELPSALHPGDTIQPNIRIQNLGPASTSTQASSFFVDLVASTGNVGGPGSSIVARYVVQNIPGVSLAPTKRLVTGDANLDPPVNIVTITGAPVTLPTSPGVYNLGVVIDPQFKVQQIHQIGRGPDRRLQLLRRVGPPAKNLPPAGVLANVPPSTNVFPIPPFGPVNQNRLPSGSGSTTTTNPPLTTNG